IAQERVEADITNTGKTGFDVFKTVPRLPHIVPFLITEVVDIQRVIQIRQVQGMFDTYTRGVDDVGEGTITLAFDIRVRGHYLTVEVPYTTASQVFEVHRMYGCIGLVMCYQCADVTQTTVGSPTALVLVQNTESREITTSLLIAVAIGTSENSVVLTGCQNTITHSAVLTRCLYRTQQVSVTQALTRRQADACRQVIHRWRTATNTASVQNGKALACGVVGTRRGVKNLLAFLEEQTFFREEGLAGGQVHVHIVSFCRTKIRVQRRCHLEVGGRTPEQVHTGTVFPVVIDFVKGRRHGREQTPLLAGVYAIQLKQRVVAKENWVGSGNCWPGPGLVQMGNKTLGINTNLAGTLTVRHCYLSPGQEKLGSPASFGFSGSTIPGTVPLGAVHTFRLDSTVKLVVTQRQTHPVAKLAFAGGIQRESHAVTGNVTVVAGGNTGDAGFRRLFHKRTDVQTAHGVEHTDTGVITCRDQGFRLDDTHATKGLKL